MAPAVRPVVAVIIDQADIAHLSDTELKLLVLAVLDTVDDVTAPGPAVGVADFWRRFVVALIRARRQRQRMVLEAEFDAMNDDGPGAIVGDDDDPVADALEELRRKARGEGLS